MRDSVVGDAEERPNNAKGLNSCGHAQIVRAGWEEPRAQTAFGAGIAIAPGLP